MSIDAFRKRLASIGDRIEHGEAIDYAREGDLLMLDAIDSQLALTQEGINRIKREDERIDNGMAKQGG
jgi:hypothetical protein